MATGGKYGFTYPRLNVRGEARDAYAHRWVYEQLVGEITQGMQLDHRCRVTLCVNPAHMEVVHQKENLRRRKCCNAHSKRVA